MITDIYLTFLLAACIRRGQNIEVFHVDSANWYLGTIQRVNIEDNPITINVVYPKFEGEVLIYNTSKLN